MSEPLVTFTVSYQGSTYRVMRRRPPHMDESWVVDIGTTPMTAPLATALLEAAEEHGIARVWWMREGDPGRGSIWRCRCGQVDRSGSLHEHGSTEARRDRLRRMVT
jgi:hypothetical protein